MPTHKEQWDGILMFLVLISLCTPMTTLKAVTRGTKYKDDQDSDYVLGQNSEGLRMGLKTYLSVQRQNATIKVSPTKLLEGSHLCSYITES